MPFLHTPGICIINHMIMDQSPVKLNFTPLSFRELSEKYADQERMKSMRTMAIVVTLVFTVGTGVLGFVFRDKIAQQQEATVLGAQNEAQKSQEEGKSQGLYVPNDEIPQSTAKNEKTYKDDFMIFKLPTGWNARDFSSDLLPSLVKLVEMQPANELPLVGEDGKQVRSGITISILKQKTPPEASGEAEQSDLEIDGVPATVTTEKSTMLYANVLNQRFDAQLITVDFPLKNNSATIVFKLFAQSGEMQKKREEFFKFVRSIDLVGIEPVKPTPTPEATDEAELTEDGEETVETNVWGEPIELRQSQGAGEEATDETTGEGML